MTPFLRGKWTFTNEFILGHHRPTEIQHKTPRQDDEAKLEPVELWEEEEEET